MSTSSSDEEAAGAATRIITAHEKHLWHYVVRHDMPLHPSQTSDIISMQEALDVDGYASDQQHKQPVIKRSPAALSPEQKMLAAGVFDGVDKRTANALKRGKTKMDAVLDLHGLSQLDAFEQLQQTIATLYHKHHRTLLVITGKGEAGKGVLRAMLPMWLNAASIRPYVLAFDQAQPEHGGQGAWYVLIKRQRKPL